MEFKQLRRRAVSIKKSYDEYNKRTKKPVWDATAYLQGLVGDIGDLSKLMNQQGKKPSRDGFKRIRHEIADCFWSLMMLSQELGIDLEDELVISMDYLEQKLYESIKTGKKK